MAINFGKALAKPSQMDWLQMGLLPSLMMLTEGKVGPAAAMFGVGAKGSFKRREAATEKEALDAEIQAKINVLKAKYPGRTDAWYADAAQADMFKKFTPGVDEDDTFMGFPGKSAEANKARAMRKAGYDDSTIYTVLSNATIYQTMQHPTTGEITVLDTRTNELVPVRTQGQPDLISRADQPRPPGVGPSRLSGPGKQQIPAEGPVREDAPTGLGAAIDASYGLVPAVQRGLGQTAGQIPGIGVTEKAFGGVSTAILTIKGIQQAYSNNRRFPMGEATQLLDIFEKPGVLKSAKGARAKAAELKRSLIERYHNLERDMRTKEIGKTGRQEAAAALNGVSALLRMMADIDTSRDAGAVTDKEDAYLREKGIRK